MMVYGNKASGKFLENSVVYKEILRSAIENNRCVLKHFVRI